MRSGKNEAILLLRADLVDEEVFPRLTCNVSGVAGDALLIEQLPQQPSDRAAHRIDRVGIVTKPPDHPRDIDSAAAAGVTPLRPATQLGHRHDFIDGGREIDGRARRDRDDVGYGSFEPRWPAPAGTNLLTTPACFEHAGRGSRNLYRLADVNNPD